MKNTIVCGGILVWGLGVTGVAAAACQFPEAPTTTFNDEREVIRIWDADADLLDETAPPNAPHLAAFRADVAAQVDPDQLGLLRRQRALFFEAFGMEQALRFDNLISGAFGRIGTRGCVEALLLETHQAAWEDAAREAEFQAVILRRGGRLRIYFLSGTEIGPPELTPVMPRVRADLAAGWRLAAHLHNHPFFFQNSSGDIAGTVIPSDGDVGEYHRLAREHGLAEAWITNGFDTMRVGSDEFGEL